MRLNRFFLSLFGGVLLILLTALSFRPEQEARFVLFYRVDVPSLPRNKEKLRLWIPFPRENTAQKILRSKITSPVPWRIEKDPKYKNPILFVEAVAHGEPFTLLMELEILRKEERGLPEREEPRNYLSPSPSVPFSPLIEKTAGEVAGPYAAQEEKIRALYDYVYETMTYSKEGQGWGRGDPIWACLNKKGNCTDFHSFFIAMAQAQGIPARFEIGLPLAAEGRIPGYHCWAQVYEPNRGWIPLDISESKKKGRREAFFGRLPPDRILLSIGRDIILNPPQQGKPLNFFFNPYGEVDGQEVKNIQASYRFKKMR